MQAKAGGDESKSPGVLNNPWSDRILADFRFKEATGGVVTLGPGIGSPALIAWYMRVIFGPGSCRHLMKVTVKIEQGSVHVRKAGRGGILLR